MHSPFDDLAALPSDVASNLKRSLNRPKDLVGESIARAFLQALVHLIGGYREALKHRQVSDGEEVRYRWTARGSYHVESKTYLH